MPAADIRSACLLGIRQRRVHADLSPVGILEEHLKRRPMLFLERVKDRGTGRRSELGSLLYPDGGYDLLRLTGRSLGNEKIRTARGVAHQTRVVIGLEFQVVSQTLPESYRLAPVMGLNQPTLDAFSCHVSSASSAGRPDRRATLRRRSRITTVRSLRRCISPPGSFRGANTRLTA